MTRWARRARVFRYASFAALAWCALAITARADDASDAAVKAGFVYNIAKFTEWPTEVFASGTAPLQLCAVGLPPLQGKLGLLIGRAVQGHAVNLRLNPRADELSTCQILYVDDTEARRAGALIGLVAASPVLTVSDIDGFAESGGIIGLYLDGDRVRFNVNLRAARQAGLKLSAQVLRLGRVTP
jgi:hypothetical protein